MKTWSRNGLMIISLGLEKLKIIHYASLDKTKEEQKQMKLFEQDNYFIVKERPNRRQSPHAYNNNLTLLVKKTRFNEYGEHQHGVKWVTDLEAGKAFIEREIEKGR